MYDLKKLYNECIISLNSIGYYPNVVNIELNNRLSSTYGCYNPMKNTIELNKKVFLTADEEQLKCLIIHELSHNIDFLLNGNDELDSTQGHGDSWQIIANDISKKLGVKIQRYSTFHVDINNQYPQKNNHTYQCKNCGLKKTIVSKYKDKSLVRTKKCEYCSKNDFEYLFNGQYAFSLKTMETIILYDK